MSHNLSQAEIESLAAIRDAFQELEYNEAVKKQNEAELDQFAIVGTDTKHELLGMLQKSASENEGLKSKLQKSTLENEGLKSENEQLKCNLSEKDKRILQLEALLEKAKEKVEDKRISRFYHDSDQV